MGDQIRWLPTDHMLVDCITKDMKPDAMLSYLQKGEYAFKFDEVVQQTKREQQKARKAKKEARLSAANLVYDVYYMAEVDKHCRDVERYDFDHLREDPEDDVCWC